MRGSIRQRGSSSWQLRIYAGDGLQVSRTVRGSRREAEIALAKLVTEVAEGRRLPSRGRTVGMLLERYLEVKSTDWSPEQATEQHRKVQRDIKPAFGDVPLSRLSTEDIDVFYGRLRRRGLAPGSIRRIHSILHAALEHGARWGWIGLNPAGRAHVPAVPEPEIRSPEPAELIRLLAWLQAEMPEFAVYIHLAAHTGARRGRLLALRWHDVDLTASTVTITQPSRRKGTTRTVALDEEMAARLATHHRGMRERALACGTHLSKWAYIFSDDAACRMPWKGDTVTHRFIKARRRAGLGDSIRLHDLRHYVATQLLGAGHDVRTVAERLGQDPRTTLRVYAHFLPVRDRAAAEYLAQILRDVKRESKD